MASIAGSKPVATEQVTSFRPVSPVQLVAPRQKATLDSNVVGEINFTPVQVISMSCGSGRYSPGSNMFFFSMPIEGREQKFQVPNAYKGRYNIVRDVNAFVYLLKVAAASSGRMSPFSPLHLASRFFP